MCKFIGIESIIANALIEKLSLNGKQLSLEEIKTYGYCVCDIINEKTKERAIIIHEKDSISNFIINYSKYFEIIEENNKEYIKVKEHVDIEDLKDLFRWDLPIYLIEAYSESKSVLIS